MKIVLPGARTYTPGVTQRIKVEIDDAAERRWGFELTARLASDPAASQAGDLTATDANSQAMCANGRSKPCASASTIQYITHTLAGSRNGTTGPVQFEFDWTPPAAASDKVTIYAAANAANGDNRVTGDHVYTASIDLDPAEAAPVKPAIRSERGVVNGASLQPGVAAGSWISIFGTNLASTTRTWTPADFVEGQPPLSLDGVSVTVNGKAAWVQSVSPEKLTVLAAADDAVGPVEVRVTADGRTSDPAVVELLPLSPAFFVGEDGKHVLVAAEGESLIAEPARMPSVTAQKTTVKPGETVVLYGVGFGPTDPDVPLTAITPDDGEAGIVNPITITIGGVAAEVSSAMLAPGTLHVYRFVVKVAESLAEGEQAIVAQVGSALSPEQCCFLVVRH